MKSKSIQAEVIVVIGAKADALTLTGIDGAYLIGSAIELQV
jgi:hypothetical protein